MREKNRIGYHIGAYEFDSFTAYAAAGRDMKIIDSLCVMGRTRAEIKRYYRLQIYAEGIKFESEIGSDFLKAIDMPGFWQNSQENNRAFRGIWRLKQLVLTVLYVLLGAVLITIFVQINGGFSKERKNDTVEKQEADADVPEAMLMQQEPVAVRGKKEHGKVILPELQSYYEVNEDMIGWLTIPGMAIDFPVVYLPDDNEYYLTHNFEKEEDKNGAIFLDKRCNPEGSVNYLIHGHNMKSGAMFGTLDQYEEEDFGKKHGTIIFSSLYEKREFEVMAVLLSSVYDENTTDFPYYDYISIDNEDAFNEYTGGAMERSLYDTGVHAEWGDTLITLSTCDYWKTNGRLVIVGREKR